MQKCQYRQFRNCLLALQFQTFGFLLHLEEFLCLFRPDPPDQLKPSFYRPLAQLHPPGNFINQIPIHPHHRDLFQLFIVQLIQQVLTSLRQLGADVIELGAMVQRQGSIGNAVNGGQRVDGAIDQQLTPEALLDIGFPGRPGPPISAGRRRARR